MNPLLLLFLAGGGLYVLTRDKKDIRAKRAPRTKIAGFDLLSDCSILISEEDDADTFRYMREFSIQKYGAYPPPPGAAEEFAIAMFSSLFPQCSWPPAPGWTIGQDGKFASWNAMVGQLEERFSDTRGGA